MWGINSKIWYVLFVLWLMILLVIYLDSEIEESNINSLLNIFVSILVTASVGVGAIALVFIKTKYMITILDMVFILIFLSISSALLAHTNHFKYFDIFIVKKVQVFINVAVMTTSFSFIGGYLIGLLNTKESVKIERLNKKNKSVRHSK